MLSSKGCSTFRHNAAQWPTSKVLTLVGNDKDRQVS
jgi:hypothetical protein